MPNLTVRTFDPKQVKITFGAFSLSGFAEGTFASVERSGDAFEKSKGSDGTVDRINKNAFDFRATITLKGTAPDNEVLSAIFNADMLSNTGVLPLTIKDLNGTSLFEAPQAWIAKDPTMEMSDSFTNREWVFDTGAAALLVGGNS